MGQLQDSDGDRMASLSAMDIRSLLDTVEAEVGRAKSVLKEDSAAYCYWGSGSLDFGGFEDRY